MEVGITNDIGAAYQSIPNVLALSMRATTAVALGLLVESADIGPCTLIEAPAAPRPIVETRQNWARRRCALLLLLRLRGQGVSRDERSTNSFQSSRSTNYFLIFPLLNIQTEL